MSRWPSCEICCSFIDLANKYDSLKNLFMYYIFKIYVAKKHIEAPTNTKITFSLLIQTKEIQNIWFWIFVISSYKGSSYVALTSWKAVSISFANWELIVYVLINCLIKRTVLVRRRVRRRLSLKKAGRKKKSSWQNEKLCRPLSVFTPVLSYTEVLF